MPGSQVELGFDVFDADNHYYEAPDAFTRHLDPAMAKRCMQWAEVNGKPRLMVAGKLNRFIPNPLFDPVARPGCLDEYFRGRSPADDIRGAFGELEPIRPEYRDPRPGWRCSTGRASRPASCSRPSASAWRRRCCTTPRPPTPPSARSTAGSTTTGASHYEDRIFGAPYITPARSRRGEGRGRVGARAGRPGRS